MPGFFFFFFGGYCETNSGSLVCEPSRGWYLFSSFLRWDKRHVFKVEGQGHLWGRVQDIVDPLAVSQAYYTYCFSSLLMMMSQPTTFLSFTSTRPSKTSQRSWPLGGLTSWQNIALQLIDHVDRKALMIKYYQGRLWLVSTQEQSNIWDHLGKLYAFVTPRLLEFL